MYESEVKGEIHNPHVFPHPSPSRLGLVKSLPFVALVPQSIPAHAHWTLPHFLPMRLFFAHAPPFAHAPIPSHAFCAPTTDSQRQAQAQACTCVTFGFCPPITIHLHSHLVLALDCCYFHLALLPSHHHRFVGCAHMHICAPLTLDLRAHNSHLLTCDTPLCCWPWPSHCHSVKSVPLHALPLKASSISTSHPTVCCHLPCGRYYFLPYHLSS